MAEQQYDATFKDLVEAFPADWVRFLGLPAGTEVAVIEAELSTLTTAADKVPRVGGPSPYIVHLEFQSGYDATLDSRVLMYNVLLRRRHGLPVRSVVILLHPRALTSRVRGGVSDPEFSEFRLDFAYRLVRVWEQPAEAFLNGPVGTLPLTAAAAVASEAHLSRVLDGVAQRLRHEAPRERAPELWAATYLLGGLRHDRDVVERLMAMIWNMELEESSTYQATIEKGMARGLERGRILEARRAILRIGRQRLGEADGSVVARLDAIEDPQRLESIMDRLLAVASWDELLAS